MKDTEKFIITRWLYSLMVEPLMTDFEYNAMLRNFREQGILREYTERSWSDDPCPVELLNKYNLPYVYKVVNTDKTESMESLLTPAAIEVYYAGKEGPFHLSYKEDGINIQKTYYNGELVSIQSRGRATDAIDFSVLIPYDNVKKIPLLGEVKVIGEMQISNKSFEELKKIRPDIKSQRGSIRSAISDTATYHLLTFRAFDLSIGGKYVPPFKAYAKLTEFGFDTPSYIEVQTAQEILQAVKYLSEGREAYPFQTDGVVIRPASGLDKKAARIYNWSEQIQSSYITGYEETPSEVYFGTKVLIKPVNVKGSTISRVNVTNLKTVVQYNLREGQPVAFIMRSDAIPVVDLEETRQLQEIWEGNLQAYRSKIDNEKNKGKQFVL